MKKHILLLLMIATILVSCEKILDVEPSASISAESALSDSVGVERAIIGSYSALQLIGTYGRNLAIVSDLAADNLRWTGTSQPYGQIPIKPIPADNSIIEGMWSAAYTAINRVNNILLQLPSISYKSANGKNGAMGEALFIRALMHFNLGSYFGGVPLRTNPTTDLSMIDLEKSPLEVVYESVIIDLETAQGMLRTSNITGRATQASAAALLARAYLAHYHLTANAESATKAVAKATQLISGTTFALAPSYGSLFEKGTTTRESIFEVVYDVQNFNRLAQYYFPRELEGRYEVSPTQGLVESFATNDSRRTTSIAYDSKNNPYCFKYKDVSGGTDRVYVLRLAEMYLIRAEALAYTNGSIASIQADVNTIRNRAGLQNTTAANYTALKLAIENENRFEFAFEGLRWHQLVRTKRAVSVLGIDEKHTLFPIPLREMQTNTKITQNPGY